MTALSRYLVMLGRAIEYKKAALVKENTAALEVRDQVRDPRKDTMIGPASLWHKRAGVSNTITHIGLSVKAYLS